MLHPLLGKSPGWEPLVWGGGGNDWLDPHERCGPFYTHKQGLQREAMQSTGELVFRVQFLEKKSGGKYYSVMPNPPPGGNAT